MQKPENTKLKIPKPVSGGLLLSYKCSAACRHCMYGCSPAWEGDWISEKDLEEVLTLLADKIEPSPWGNQSVSLNHGLHFTGGEPFLNFDRLATAVEIAEDLRIPSTFVETNGFWCRTDDETREKLMILRSKGLKGMMISVNPFYAEYVPFDRTERCIHISQDIFGNNSIVYQATYYHLFRQLGIRDKISFEAFLERTKESHIESVELFLMGRAARQLRAFYPSYPAHQFFDEPCPTPLLRNWHNHFDNYGNIIPGYCGGIALGHWRDLDSLINEGIDLEKYPVLKYLVLDDIQGLFSFAREFGYEESQEGYVSKCDLCIDIRKHLVTANDFEELKPKSFYTHL